MSVFKRCLLDAADPHEAKSNTFYLLHEKYDSLFRSLSLDKDGEGNVESPSGWFCTIEISRDEASRILFDRQMQNDFEEVRRMWDWQLEGNYFVRVDNSGLVCVWGCDRYEDMTALFQQHQEEYLAWEEA